MRNFFLKICTAQKLLPDYTYTEIRAALISILLIFEYKPPYIFRAKMPFINFLKEGQQDEKR